MQGHVHCNITSEPFMSCMYGHVHFENICTSEPLFHGHVNFANICTSEPLIHGHVTSENCI